MAKITAAAVKELRDKTGAGMMDSKNALVEADGDIAKAIEILRVKGAKKVEKREGRTAGNGLVAYHISEDAKRGILLEINAETDFVAKNENFTTMAEEIVSAAVDSGASDVETLLAAPLADGTVQDRINGLIAVMGEKMEVSHLYVLEGDHVEAYMHRTNPDLPPQVGVLVATDDAAASVAHDVAVQIAAMDPQYLSEADIPDSVRETETRVAMEKTKVEEEEKAAANPKYKAKPEQVLAKIVEGRVKKSLKESVLLDQEYQRDPQFSVGDIVKKTGGTVTGFVRLRVGASAE
ncbi:MAG: translation elongation factor Ts [Actinomycetaceae bacterium]|nr:translation elongation factor Ts [Actinomycetaceae bacterium]MDY6082982.1 translation elongation factor Ts [Actinomycetaceae bacterium]